jgi:hypothetical protein
LEIGVVVVGGADAVVDLADVDAQSAEDALVESRAAFISIATPMRSVLRDLVSHAGRWL